MRVWDVVLETREVITRKAERFLHDQPPPRERFDLAGGLWIGQLGNETAQRVIEACELRDIERCGPHGTWREIKPVIPFEQLYAFVREGVPDEWDRDNRLQICIALSRLVYPTPISFEYAARITYKSDGSIKIKPARVKGFRSEAYVASDDQRMWLTESDLQELRDLLAKWDAAHLPPRIKRALWHHEFAARTRELAVRWTLICTALEALVHTDRDKSTKQFTKRVSQLAKEVGIVPFDEKDDAGKMYELRSGISHGQGLASLKDQERTLYERMEHVLRKALMRAIRDQEFAKIFECDSEIRNRWPVNS